ncbi:Hydroxyquinol 1,2-dioxygenase [Pigmentiphaga humi]|uniref:Hydroxyquinol 1,2-dioxygenase n=1 Tax=Pigmentiphaga humi TaxID=2478468 RepID=A0A3P4B0X5_9BURK|nr:dioxygenase [Pigmentiphaga humi]VCU69692.1 Hydroxyquinol 1,2-dioxygenase [Pigmentiphaga humi]
MLPSTPESLLPIVVQSMSKTPDARLKELLTSLVRHLHAFVLETRLTEAEFEYALGYVNAIGQATCDTKNEAVLVADLLGVSSLVALLNNADSHGESDAALLGPFWRANSLAMPPGASIASADTPGLPLEGSGTVRDAAGRPLAGVTVDIWHASPCGLYENQDQTQPDMNLRGRFQTDEQGRFQFRSVRPAGYPVPVDGPGGVLLRAQARHEFRPAHLHFMCSKPGYKVLITQVYADDSEYLHSDPTFGVTRRLVGQYKVEQRPGGAVAVFDHDFTLLEGEMVFPHPPIP